jgi:hypothetical protein
MIEVGGQETIEIDALLQELRKRVEVSAAVVRQLCDDLQVEAVVLCGVGQHEDAITTPALCFPADFLKWVADLGASLMLTLSCRGVGHIMSASVVAKRRALGGAQMENPIVIGFDVAHDGLC